MPIIVRLDVMLAKRKMKLSELAERVGITVSNLSVLKNDARAVKLTTMARICRELDCQPGDLFEYVPGEEKEWGEE